MFGRRRLLLLTLAMSFAASPAVAELQGASVLGGPGIMLPGVPMNPKGRSGQPAAPISSPTSDPGSTPGSAPGSHPAVYDPGARSGSGLRDGVQSIAFSPDGRIVARRTRYGALALWDVRTAGLLHAWYDTPLTGAWSNSSDASVTFSPNGQWVASPSYVVKDALNGQLQPVVRIRSIQTGETVRTLDTPVVPARALAFSPDGRWLAGVVQGEALLWDPSTGETKGRWTLRAGSDASMRFSSDGRYLEVDGRPGAGGSSSGVWDTTTGQALNVAPADAQWAPGVVLDRFAAMTVAPTRGTTDVGRFATPVDGGKQIVSLTQANFVRWSDAATLNERLSRPVGDTGGSVFAASADGASAAVGFPDGSVVLVGSGPNVTARTLKAPLRHWAWGDTP